MSGGHTKIATVNRHDVHIAALICVLLVLSSCATQSFVAAPVGPSDFTQRGISQTDQSVIVTVAVPTAEEIIELLGVDLYADGIQPVWMHVENGRDAHVRVAHFSIDNNYFAPLEVAWLYRKRFSKSSRDNLDRWFIDNAMPRYVPAGESRTGFVFTHATEGTKGMNVDVYAGTDAISFTFFVPLPGFKPDYMNVDFEGLYNDEEIFVGDLDDLRNKVAGMPCCTTSESGQESGDPLNVVIVGPPAAVRRALLRGGWQETETDSPVTRVARLHYYKGRSPDGTFHKSRPDGRERKELRLWLAPMLIDSETVWLGHISYDMSGALSNSDLTAYQIDPDVDDARMFLLQNFWYNQSLRSHAMAAGVPAATVDSPRTNFRGGEYFTDGLRVVLLVSEEPVAMDETRSLLWGRYRAE
jgi:hypothetical protein